MFYILLLIIILIRLTSATELVESWCSWSPVSSVEDVLIISFLLSISSEVDTFLSPFHVESYHALHTKSSFLKISSSPGKSPSSLDNAAKLAWRLLRELLTNGKALENLWNIQEICTNPQEIWKNLWRNQICLEMTKAQWPQKVQLASIFYIFYFKLIRPTLEVAHFQRGDSHNVVEKTSLSFFDIS